MLVVLYISIITFRSSYFILFFVNKIYYGPALDQVLDRLRVAGRQRIVSYVNFKSANAGHRKRDFRRQPMGQVHHDTRLVQGRKVTVLTSASLQARSSNGFFDKVLRFESECILLFNAYYLTFLVLLLPIVNIASAFLQSLVMTRESQIFFSAFAPNLLLHLRNSNYNQWFHLFILCTSKRKSEGNNGEID